MSFLLFKDRIISARFKPMTTFIERLYSSQPFHMFETRIPFREYLEQTFGNKITIKQKLGIV